MADIPTQTPATDTNHTVPLNMGADHQGILDQTLGEVLKSNPQAQGMVMQSMHLSPEKFQQLLSVANNNALMSTKIRDLFSSGVMQQAMAQQDQNTQQVSQIDPSQMQQITPEQIAQMQAGDSTTVQPLSQTPSLMQKVKKLFGI